MLNFFINLFSKYLLLLFLFHNFSAVDPQSLGSWASKYAIIINTGIIKGSSKYSQ